MPKLAITECPRDAMQGIHDFIATVDKVRYIQSLFAVGFDTLDLGSFVSPKAIPQMADTAEVLSAVSQMARRSKVLTIVANTKGAEQAGGVGVVDYLGYPFSISETFQRRNTNAGIAESLERVKQINEMALGANKALVVYISMAFGNPYGDAWSADLTLKWAEQLAALGIRHLALADTTGVAQTQDIAGLFATLIPALPEVRLGAHLHTRADNWYDKVKAAFDNGCIHFDTAINGFGGCPMASDDLTGNLATENLLRFAAEQHLETGLDLDALRVSQVIAQSIFPTPL